LPWIDGVKSVSDAQAMIVSYQKTFQAGKTLDLGIKYNGQWVGSIGFNDLVSEIGTGPIGFWMGESFQGKGIMTDVVRALTSYGFEKLKLKDVVIHCAVNNVRSRNIPDRLGFFESGMIKNGEWLYNHFVDLIVYRVSKTEWKSLQKRKPKKLAMC
jgi:ribosomal-protein-serine acetyltransferase